MNVSMVGHCMPLSRKENVCKDYAFLLRITHCQTFPNIITMQLYSTRRLVICIYELQEKYTVLNNIAFMYCLSGLYTSLTISEREHLGVSERVILPREIFPDL